MKWLFALLAALCLAACAGLDLDDEGETPKTAPAQVGIVNHTGNYIYSASISGIGWQGGGGGNMSEWSGAMASMCCASIPKVWRPGLKGSVRWNMPIGRKDVIKEKTVEVEKYDETGSIYLHFFPDDIVRVVVSPVGPRSPKHPIPPPIKPVNAR